MGLNRNRSTKEKEYHVVDGTDNVIGLLVEGRDFEGELKILVIFLQVRLGLQPPAQLTNITFYLINKKLYNHAIIKIRYLHYYYYYVFIEL